MRPPKISYGSVSSFALLQGHKNFMAVLTGIGVEHWGLRVGDDEEEEEEAKAQEDNDRFGDQTLIFAAQIHVDAADRSGHA
ncbi:hypothetical protein Scep_016099 [Stephania cephalantha]|uniref:Uncharacterized protein n=1 Tax=Stephania cephalantha TaxID=152367 RepID=A0AAP0INP3_9MAGN